MYRRRSYFSSLPGFKIGSQLIMSDWIPVITLHNITKSRIYVCNNTWRSVYRQSLLGVLYSRYGFGQHYLLLVTPRHWVPVFYIYYRFDQNPVNLICSTKGPCGTFRVVQHGTRWTYRYLSSGVKEKEDDFRKPGYCLLDPKYKHILFIIIHPKPSEE